MEFGEALKVMKYNHEVVRGEKTKTKLAYANGNIKMWDERASSWMDLTSIPIEFIKDTYREMPKKSTSTPSGTLLGQTADGEYVVLEGTPEQRATFETLKRMCSKEELDKMFKGYIKKS